MLYTLTIFQDFSWNARQGDHVIPKDGVVFDGVSGTLQSVEGVISLLDLLNCCKLCTGNDGEVFKISHMASREIYGSFNVN